ncbi:MAG: hypothetical protein AB1490_28145 [Pseudomonadota bacterium]
MQKHNSAIWALLLALRRAFVIRGENYSPERYYMRGPGPKWREKHSALGPQVKRGVSEPSAF